VALSTLRLVAIALLLAMAAPLPAGRAQPSVPDPASQLLPVDCLLPGKIRKLGRHVTYVTPRQPLKTTALDCEIRGGEYVSHDRASYDTALAVWLPQAEAGDARAQNYVGEIHERGLGVQPDHAAAAEWYRKAAEQGYGPAQINLGQLLEQGLGVPRDVPAAMRWYEKASGLDEVGLPYVAEVPAARPPSARPTPAPASDDVARAEEAARAAQARAEAAQAELARMRVEQQAEERALAGQREELAQSRRRLDETRRELAEAEAALRARRAEAAAAASDAADAEALRRRAEELAERERALADRQAALGERQQALASREDALAATREELARRQQALAAEARRPAATPEATPAPAVEMPAPSIHLIDPQVLATRSTERVTVEPGERVVVGRVDAPAGLMALSLNGAETPVEPNGIFKGKVTVSGDETRVALVAVDRQGKRTERSVLFVVPSASRAQAGTAAAAPAARPRAPDIDFGRYHALVIGNDRYQRLPRLQTATADAQAVADLLRDRYGFRVKLLLNADRYQILSALNELRAELDQEDNLLIYYAGHGEIDETNMRGHWLPVDAEPDSTANWISNASLTDLLNAMNARHVLVVADSCYSGALTRSALARLERGLTPEARIAWQTKMAEGRSRTALTSGGLAPVMDGGGGKHSVFAKTFLQVLESNDEVLEGQRLFSRLSAVVTWAADAQRFEQLPEYAPIKYAGHESGDFFFVPRGS